MFTKEFTFTDYNGKEKKASYTFSLEKDEMLRMELGNYGGLQHTMKRMMDEERPDKVLDLLENIILTSVGEVSPDGSSFYKNEKIREAFRQTKVCHDLLFELMSDEKALQAFILGAIPTELAAKMAENKDESSEEDGKVVTLPSAESAVSENAPH